MQLCDVRFGSLAVVHDSTSSTSAFGTEADIRFPGDSEMVDKVEYFRPDNEAGNDDAKD